LFCLLAGCFCLLFSFGDLLGDRAITRKRGAIRMKNLKFFTGQIKADA
jgi:hypothetical protein